MTFLPIAARELSVAARRPGTYRLRTYAVVIMLILFAVVSRSNVPRQLLGHQILTALGVATLGFSMLAGLLLTANSIADEKEGGTLGLLFLTDLKGYDIVLGKLAAHSVSAYFGLLAVFPVLAIPLLMGSVKGAEFWRMLLVFGTTLFFSTALGLLVSSMTSDSKKALGLAFLLMAAAAGILPAVWWLQKITIDNYWMDFLLWPSPAYAFRYSFDAWYGVKPAGDEYWRSLLTMWILTLVCLVWASFVTPRAWQKEMKSGKLRKAKPKPRGWAKAEARDPFCRVTIRDWAPSSLANGLLAVGVPIWLCFFFFIPTSGRIGPPTPFLICLFMAAALHIIVKILMMVESVSRLNHDRNSGALELLLVTPLAVKSIIEAQDKALREHFRASIWTLSLVNLALLSWVVRSGEALGMDSDAQWIFAELFVGGIVALLADFAALKWVGMWHGLTKRKAYKAVLLTVVQLMGPCWAFTFILVFAEPRFGSGDVSKVFAFWFFVGWVVDAFCGARARGRLEDNFREVATQRF